MPIILLSLANRDRRAAPTVEGLSHRKFRDVEHHAEIY
jgi:hypothetical protein